MKCLICDCNSIEEFHNYTQFVLLRCKKCNLIFRDQTNPAAISNLISLIYTEEWVKMRAKYTEDTFIGHTAFANQFVEMFSPNKGNLLEIGSGTGEFLFLAQEAGWDAIGCEPSAEACSYARGQYNVNIINDFFHKGLFGQKQKFDAIVFWHVLEHLPDPLTFFAEVRSVLKPYGIIFFSIPNNDSYHNSLLGYNSPLYKEPDHFFHYSKDNLLQLLKKAALKPITIFSRETNERMSSDFDLALRLGKLNKNIDLKEWIRTQTRLQAEFKGYELFCAALPHS